MRPVHADHEVFTITGRAVGGAGDGKGAFVVAESEDHVTRTFSEWGFEITSIASLADVSQNLEILEAISTKDAKVSATEFLDLLPSPGRCRRDASHVFTFVGRPIQFQTKTLQAGFATAADRATLTQYLREHGFETIAMLSYNEVQELHHQMRLIADEAEDDASHTINVKP